MDLMFAISATSTANFQTMKETINEIVERFGINQTHYSVIVFGVNPYKSIDFGDYFSSKQKLKGFISALSNKPGKPALDKALDEATRGFDGRSARTNVRKVLVVVMDSNSSISDGILKTKAMQLERKKVKIVSVALGNKASPAQLGVIVSHKQNLVVVPGMENPYTIAGDVVDAILKSKQK